MGNLCGKESSDPFAQPGRTLGSAPPPSEGTSRLPAGVSSTVGGPGHTLGGSGPSATDDARRAAALAAEERARSSHNQAKGKLGRDLTTQKQQSRVNTLGQASRQEQQYRDADANAAVRNWD
ncbi:MAG: hypothetical protein M1815_004739 [Lichina confinis]|nr:MAG: hypothetical protein M1815_004739 [Lichina confinis]